MRAHRAPHIHLPVGTAVTSPYKGRERRMATIEATLGQHLTDCLKQNERVDKRLWRVEWLIITSAAAMIALLCKLAFLSP